MAVRGLSAITVAAALVLSASPAVAFTVDGKLSTDDNYTATYNLDFYVWNTQSGGNQLVDGGKLRVGRDGDAGDIFLMVEVPVALVDNVYGEAAGHPDSGWTQPIGHPFKALSHSDAFEFVVSTTYGDKFLKVDYLDKHTNEARVAYSGYGTLLEVSTSLEYNLSQGYGDTTNSPDPFANPPSGWIQAVQYELRLNGSRFAPGSLVGLADLSSAWLHASPNKLRGDDKVKLKCLYYNSCELAEEEQEPPPVAIPAPGGGAIFALATGFLGFMRRRRRNDRA